MATSKPRSGDVTEGDRRAPARAMLRAVGLTDDDVDKPQIGIASSWNEITPCNLSLDRLAKSAKDGVRAAGGVALEFGTISVSDAISMGHEGMHASLVSREVIADSVETVMFAERLDGSVLLAGCDKSLPGKLDRTELDALERETCPGEGACAGMYTANTMASAAEALGMSMPGSAAPPAADRRRDHFAHLSGEAVVNLIRNGITARDIMTKKAFENAIAVVMALGGSTNAVLHLLAIAHEAE